MPSSPISFGINSYVDRSLPVSSQQLVNMYVSQKPDDAKSRAIVEGTPGLKKWIDIGIGPIRGLHRLNKDTLMVMSGPTLYSVSTGGVVTDIGTFSSGTNLVKMASAGPTKQTAGYTLYVVSDTTTHMYKTSDGSLVKVIQFDSTDPFPAMSQVVYLDGFLVFSEADTQTFYVSESEYPHTIEGEAISGIKVAFPDNIVTMGVANRILWVLGEESTELFYNSGAAFFPFTRMPSGVISIGCMAKNSAVSFLGDLFWLGSDFNVYRAAGLRPAIVTTPAIQHRIEALANPEAATAFIYRQYGHIFYVINFDEATFVFDIATGLWHERKSEGLVLDRKCWRAQEYVTFNRKRLVGDIEHGKLYELDLDTFTDDGEMIKRIMVSAPIHFGLNRATVSRFTFDMEVGVGLPTGQGEDPTVMLDWSDDGGFTYKNAMWRSAGKIGLYNHRVFWDRLGQTRWRTWRVQISDPIKITGIEAYMDAEGGEE